MNALQNRNKALRAAALCCITLVGCSAKPGTTSQVAPQTAPTLSPEQRSQEQARVLQAIKTMTPEQRAAYFKSHPQDAAVLTR